MGSVCLAQPQFSLLVSVPRCFLFFLCGSKSRRDSPPFYSISLLLLQSSTAVPSITLVRKMMRFQLLSSFTPRQEKPVLFSCTFELVDLWSGLWVLCTAIGRRCRNWNSCCPFALFFPHHVFSSALHLVKSCLFPVVFYLLRSVEPSCTKKQNIMFHYNLFPVSRKHIYSIYTIVAFRRLVGLNRSRRVQQLSLWCQWLKGRLKVQKYYLPHLTVCACLLYLPQPVGICSYILTYQNTKSGTIICR